MRRVVWTEAALSDLDHILRYTKAEFPSRLMLLQTRLNALAERLAAQPESGRRVQGRPGVRVVPLLRFPFRIFYSTAEDRIDILHVRHIARRPWA